MYDVARQAQLCTGALPLSRGAALAWVSGAPGVLALPG